MPAIELRAPTPLPERTDALPTRTPEKKPVRTIWQLLRFGLVGCVNTLIDVLLLNCLLWIWPVQHNTALLLLANSFAYAFGALNSFVLNRYWTFQRSGRITLREVERFSLTTVVALVCNDLFLWLLNGALHPSQISPALWTNISKVGAIGCTVLISYLGMRLWVFVQSSRETSLSDQECTRQKQFPFQIPVHLSQTTTARSLPTTHSLSLVLPVYNEEQIIATTIEQAVHVLAEHVKDFEVIAVNDGSTDRTASILAGLVAVDPRVRVITHERNQGYGATLVDGFAAATEELTLFMDSDGQFDIRDLEPLLTFIDEYDAVIGYRLKRQDTWMRKLNAWGWKLIVGLFLGLRVHDIDCAFKILRTNFLHDHPLETRGAMINAELLYKLNSAGCTIREIAVHHLPRQGGKATGAKLSVIVRAFRELFIYSRKWQR